MEPQQKPIPLEYMAPEALPNGRLSARQICVGAAISIVLALLAYGTLLPGNPEIYAPLNFLVFIPLLWMDRVLPQVEVLVAVAIFPILFWIWCQPVLRGSPTVPKRSIVLLICAVLLSAVWVIGGNLDGSQYQSTAYLMGTAIISIVFWISLGVLAVVAWRYPSAGRNLLFHVVLFAWLAWYAFPYFGELAF